MWLERDALANLMEISYKNMLFQLGKLPKAKAIYFIESDRLGFIFPDFVRIYLY